MAGVRTLLVVSQIALAFVLIVGAGLAVRTFSNLLQIDPGFDPHNVLAIVKQSCRSDSIEKKEEPYLQCLTWPLRFLSNKKTMA